ncbi:putative methyltransferase nsun6 [Balamuthia mandrillaris]
MEEEKEWNHRTKLHPSVVELLASYYQHHVGAPTAPEGGSDLVTAPSNGDLDRLLSALARPPSLTTLRVNSQAFAAAASPSHEQNMEQARSALIQHLIEEEGRTEEQLSTLSKDSLATTTTTNTDTSSSSSSELQMKQEREQKGRTEAMGVRFEEIRPHASLFDVLTLPCEVCLFRFCSRSSEEESKERTRENESRDKERNNGREITEQTKQGPNKEVKAGGNPPIVVDRKCGEAIMRGADIFAPGVLAAAAGVRHGEKVSVWIQMENGKLTRGEVVHSTDGMLFVGNGVTLYGRSALFSTQSGVAIKMTEKVFNTPPLNGVLSQYLFLQNLPSIVVGHVLDPQPGEMILDMCAAPGGKTTHIAALAQDRACVIGNRPTLMDPQSASSLKGHAAYQRKLLHTAIALLKEGGTLVYSTCTINPLENEENVAYVLRTYPNMVLQQQASPFVLGMEGLAGTSLSPAERKLVQRFDPCLQSEMTGFFIAQFKKMPSSSASSSSSSSSLPVSASYGVRTPQILGQLPHALPGRTDSAIRGKWATMKHKWQTSSPRNKKQSTEELEEEAEEELEEQEKEEGKVKLPSKRPRPSHIIQKQKKKEGSGQCESTTMASERSACCGVEALPEEVLCQILEALPKHSVALAARACRRWFACSPPHLRQKLSVGWVVGSGRLEVLKWATANGWPWPRRLCEAAASHGQLALLQWATEEKGPKLLSQDTCTLAAKNGHLEVLKWARANGCPWSEETCQVAAANGHLEVVKWLREGGCGWNRWTCAFAAKNGHLAVLKWAKENGCHWDRWTCKFAAVEGHSEVFIWARENGCPWR